MSSQMPHGLRFSQFASATNKNVIMSAQQQPQQQTPAVPARQQRKSATPTNIPMPTPKVVMRDVKTSQTINNKSFSDTDDDEHDYFEDDCDVNLSKEERYVLLQPRAEPQGQENLSGNVTPVNDNTQLNIYEKVPSTPPATKIRYASASTDATNPPQRFSNRSVSVDLRGHSDPNGSQRNSLIQQAQQSHSNRNSIDHSNRSSLDVSQSSYSTLIIHDNNDTQPLFAAAPTSKHDLYFINSSPSPPNYNKSKDKSASRTLVNYSGHMHGNDAIPITENEQQYLNQSYVLKHLAKEVRLPNVVESTRDSGVSENTSNQVNWSVDNGTNNRSKSKSQPDLTKLSTDSPEGHEDSNSATNTLNFNDFEQLEVENNKLREQLNDCLMKVAKSQKLEQEVSNIYRVHEELVQSCERRERLERTARTRLQTDCRRLQELNRVLREQVDGLQQQLLIATTQQQQQLASTGRTQQDMLITQLIQQNKELVDANKRQYIEIQAQSATLEEQRIHINVLDSALKRLEEELRQKQHYQKQLQSLLSTNERRDKLRLELENEFSKDLNRTPPSESNLKWQLREKDSQIMRLEAECSKLEQRNLDEGRKMAMGDGSAQDTERIISEAHSAQRKVDELQTRLKMVENRLAEKEKEDILRQLQEQKLYTGNPAYNLLNNTPSSSSIVSSTPTTPLIYNTTNYENLMPSASSSKTVSATSNSSFDALLAGAYSNLYQPNYGQKLSSVPPASSSGISPNTSCSSTTTTMQHQHQQPSITSSSSASNYLESLDEQRKTIDDQLKKLDNQLLTKICCFPSNLLGKKTAVLSEEMATLTSSNNNSDAFLQNLAHLRNQRENTPANSSNSGKNEEISLLEKQGRSSQKLRSNLAQVSSTIGHNMNDISNIGNQSDASKLPKIILPPRKDRQSSAPPSALPRPPRSLKPPRKLEYGRLSETDSNKSNSNKSEYEMKTSSLKRHQSPVTSTGSKNFVDIKSELQMALNSTKNCPKSYGTIKNDTASNITKIYYSNKPDYLSTKNYQRLPDSPSSADSQKRFGIGASPKKITFMRQSPQNSQQHHQQSREGSISSGSNSRSSPKPPEVAYQSLTQRSRTRTPPKYLNLNQPPAGGKLNYMSNSSSPTKPTLPSSSVLHHAFQAHPSTPPNTTSSSNDWKQQHQRANSGRSNSGENKYRIQF